MPYLRLLITIIFSVYAINSFSNNNDYRQLKTFFTDLELRKTLDKLRAEKYSPAPLRTKEKALMKLNFQGVLIRNNKPPIVFINDAVLLDPPNLSLKNYTLNIRINDKSINLKPGEYLKTNNKYLQKMYPLKFITEVEIKDTLLNKK